MLLHTILLIRMLMSRVRQCPPESTARSINEDPSSDWITLKFDNDAPFDLTRWWVDLEGEEQYRGVVGAGEKDAMMIGKPGYLTRFRSLVGHRFLKEFRIPAFEDTSRRLAVRACGDAEARETETALWEPGRDAEFASLVHDQTAPCAPAADTSAWSCVRRLSPVQLAARTKEPERARWGFHEGEEGIREVGAMEDHM